MQTAKYTRQNKTKCYRDSRKMPLFHREGSCRSSRGQWTYFCSFFTLVNLIPLKELGVCGMVGLFTGFSLKRNYLLVGSRSSLADNPFCSQQHSSALFYFFGYYPCFLTRAHLALICPVEYSWQAETISNLIFQPQIPVECHQGQYIT